MLVLTRRPGEQIVIDNSIRLTVVSVGPGRVKIGIEAPAHVRIDRQEIHEKIQKEQGEPVARPAEEPTPHVVQAGDGPKLHNRIADRLPAPATPVGAAPTEAPAPHPLSRILKHRLPRKPR
jgi:carbon storage regulator